MEATSPLTIESLRSVVPEVRTAGAADSIANLAPKFVAEPASEAELARILALANSAEMQVAPRGAGTKQEWGQPSAGVDLVLSTAKLNRVLEHAPHDMTVTVEPGLTIAELQRALAQHRQRLAVDPLWPERATVGGVIATNDTGALRVRYGGIRDLIIGITVALPDGTLAKSGGKVVKNVAGYDLPKLMTGAYGTLGVITRAVFRLHPLPEDSRTVTYSFDSIAAGAAFLRAVADTKVVPTGLQMRIGAEAGVEADVRFEAITRGIEAQFAAVGKLAQSAKQDTPAGDPWQAREELWRNRDSATICKLSMFPAETAVVAEFVKDSLPSGTRWAMVAQSTGLATLRVNGSDTAKLAEFITALRSRLAPSGGSVLLLSAAAALKSSVGAWGEVGSAHSLMRRVKAQFDPSGILNRGRFAGGI